MFQIESSRHYFAVFSELLYIKLVSQIYWHGLICMTRTLTVTFFNGGVFFKQDGRNEIWREWLRMRPLVICWTVYQYVMWTSNLSGIRLLFLTMTRSRTSVIIHLCCVCAATSLRKWWDVGRIDYVSCHALLDVAFSNTDELFIFLGSDGGGTPD